MSPRWGLAVDIGGTTTSVAIVDEFGVLVSPTGRLKMSSFDSAPLFIDTLADTVGGIAHGHATRVDRVGVACPGPVDNAAGTTGTLPSIRWLSNRNLRAEISERLQLPTVLDHDAKLAAYAEHRTRATRSSTSLASIIVGTGVGAGFVVDGRVLRGPINASGEIGHTVYHIEQADPCPCTCGSQSCVQTFLAGPFLALRYEHLTGLQVEPQDIFVRAARHEREAMLIVDMAVDCLVETCASISLVLGIDTFVLSGSVAESVALHVPSGLERSRHLPFELKRRLSIELSRLGGEASLVGAGLAATVEQY